ncbi:MAG TPA: zf-HC2 domain-containing protein [Gemmatimonadaceae bacterium]|nr:zf-HC2 domain-containing protein [Gemmatimonadaceae bacterium]
MTSSRITCEAFDAALPDYLEGTLDDAARTAVEMHLRECVRCAGLVKDIENIRKESAALPDLAPSRDLWEGIEARIAAPVIPLATRPERQRRFAPAWMGVAAAALIVSTAGITYKLTTRSLAPEQRASVASTTQTPSQTQPRANAGSIPEPTNSAPATVPQQLAGNSGGLAPSGLTQRTSVPARVASVTDQADRSQSEVIYGKEIALLQKIVSQRKTQLDSSTVAIIERNLEIIDAAIEQSRAALARDPASMMLSGQLTHALDKKVELLRTAALLPAST